MMMAEVKVSILGAIDGLVEDPNAQILEKDIMYLNAAKDIYGLIKDWSPGFADD